MTRLLTLMSILVLAGAGAWASNIYSVNMECDTLPEQQPGWYREHGLPWAIRTIETDPEDPNNHFLVINSLLDQMIFDYAWYPRQIDPDAPDEVFYAEWRLLVIEQHGFPEHGIGITSDSDTKVNFKYAYDYIYSGFDGWSRPFEPGVFHTYRLESADMLHYRLWIDGQFARYGPFFEGLPDVSRASFGDFVQGGNARSVTKFDYFRFGVVHVPEPLSVGLLLGLCVCLHGGRRRGIG